MLASGVILGVVAGLALRRTWAPLVDVQIRWLPLLIGALLIRAAASFAGEPGYILYVIALTGTAVAAGVNYRLPGALLVSAGGLLNLAVVVLNHGMPVDPTALSAIGAQMPRDPLHVVVDQSTRLVWIADVIPVGIARSVYSAGDVFIAIGGFLVPFSLLTRR